MKEADCGLRTCADCSLGYAVVNLGAIPVLADIDDTFSIGPEDHALDL